MIQRKMRTLCIESFNKVYGINAKLIEMKKGRNQDYRVSQMKDYNELCNNYNKQQDKINKVNEKNIKLNSQSEQIKGIINNLTPQPLFKNNSIISNENKKLVLDYIDKVKDVNINIKDITSYSLSVERIKEDFEDNYNAMDELRSTIREQKQEINSLKSVIKNKDENINQKESLIFNLQNKIYDLVQEVQEWKEKFNKVINFIRTKVLGIFNNEDCEAYKNIADNMYINDVIDKKEYNSIINYKIKNKDKDLER